MLPVAVLVATLSISGTLDASPLRQIPLGQMIQQAQELERLLQKSVAASIKGLQNDVAFEKKLIAQLTELDETKYAERIKKAQERLKRAEKRLLDYENKK
jgi:hypothetical protein